MSVAYILFVIVNIILLFPLQVASGDDESGKTD